MSPTLTTHTPTTASALAGAAGDAPLDERGLSKLKWRCRRGLLENDLLIEQFFRRYESTLSIRQAKGMNELMELSDHDLLDLLLRRKEPGQLSDLAANTTASTPEALDVLRLLRPGAPAP
ncbi:hypothetical protein AwPolaro_03790 [Polaromonas sp.]|nr:hypothetical protein AwPolaro_03790 [Polaromonas sp.]